MNTYMYPFDVIVALDKKRGIGKNNLLPWHLPQDLAHFKALTVGKTHQQAVIMGRKTWDSLPASVRPLPNRFNIVVSSGMKPLSLPDVEWCKGFDEALVLCEALHTQSVIGAAFVIGGASLYEQALAHTACQTLHITQLEATFDCDRFFPSFDFLFKQASCTQLHTHQDLSFTFQTWDRAKR